MLLVLSSLAFAADPPAVAPAVPPAETKKVPRLSKTAIPGCGCSFYAPEGVKFDPPEKSPDGAEVWTVDTTVGSHHMGVIAVKFSAGMPTDAETLEGVLVSYLDYLKGTLKITSAAGYGKGHTMESNPAARGVIDFWKDADGDEWKVKGWVDPTHIGVMFVYGKGEFPIYNLQEMFLDGFRFE